MRREGGCDVLESPHSLMAGRPRGDQQWLRHKLHPLPHPTKHSMPGCTEVSSRSELSCSLSLFRPWIWGPVDTPLLCWWSGQKSCASSPAAFAVTLCLHFKESRKCVICLDSRVWSALSCRQPVLVAMTQPQTRCRQQDRAGVKQCRALRAGVAQQCSCKAVKPCTIPFTGAFPLTLAVIKLHYENTLWSSRDSPVLWHPGSRRQLAASRVLAGLEALGRSRYCRECPASLTAAFGAGWAGQGWIPEHRLVPLAWTHGGLWMDQRTTAGVCQGPPRETKDWVLWLWGHCMLPHSRLSPLLFILVSIWAQHQPCVCSF